MYFGVGVWGKATSRGGKLEGEGLWDLQEMGAGRDWEGRWPWVFCCRTGDEARD